MREVVAELRFRVERAGYLSSAGIWYLEGNLLCGEMADGTLAVANTVSGKVEVKVQSVAFVDPPPRDRSYITLAIEEPPCPVEELEGALLAGAEETTDSASEPSTAKKTAGRSKI